MSYVLEVTEILCVKIYKLPKTFLLVLSYLRYPAINLKDINPELLLQVILIEINSWFCQLSQSMTTYFSLD